MAGKAFAIAGAWERPDDEPQLVLEAVSLLPELAGKSIPSEHAPANGWVWLDHDPRDPDPYVREDTGEPVRAVRFLEITPLGFRAIPY